MTQPTPGYTRPYLCPEVLMDATRGTRKSHSRSGWRNGATNAPDAPSTWMGTSMPCAAWRVSSAEFTAATGSYEPSIVDPRTTTTPIVFSSHKATASGAPRWYRPGSSGTYRGWTSQYLQNFSQQTWTFVPMTIFGRSVVLPAAL